MARTRTEVVAEPELPNASEAQEGIIYYTIGLGVLIGLALGWAAWRGRQWWLLVWCGGLVISGILAMLLF